VSFGESPPLVNRSDRLPGAEMAGRPRFFVMDDADRTRTTTLHLAGMPAVHAVRAVEFALGAVPGVVAVEVTRHHAIVTHDAQVAAEHLTDAVQLVGATVTGWRIERRLPVV
jgi:copper chaperone CopZ